ncbi:MAG: site-specific integrase [Kiritimatiellaeota bacterium]|nr:site-specific integrase [Kiritimatiellota bacterium]
MPLELKPTSNWFYGRFEVNGKRMLVNLAVKIKGRRPPTLREEGDVEFECARTRAQIELEKRIEESKRQTTTETTLRKIYEAKTGQQIGGLALTEIITAWDRVPQKRARSPRYVSQAHSVLNGVSHRMVLDFLSADDTKKMSPRTWNARLILMRSVFHKLTRVAGLTENPFDGIPTKEEETAHREPFSEEELLKIFAVAKEQDPFIYPAVITGAFTGMRRGDVCLLNWDDVDLARGFIMRRQSKSGHAVEIPILKPLHDLFVALPDRAQGAFCFPELARMYQENPMGLTYRMGKVLLSAFKEGTATKDDFIKDKTGILRQDRKVGSRRANRRGFHSFRATLATMLLQRGASEEMVRLIVGHSTVDVTRRYYFKPKAEEMTRTMQAAVPAGLLNGKTEKSSQQQACDILKAMTAATWKKDRNRALKLLAEFVT